MAEKSVLSQYSRKEVILMPSWFIFMSVKCATKKIKWANVKKKKKTYFVRGHQRGICPGVAKLEGEQHVGAKLVAEAAGHDLAEPVVRELVVAAVPEPLGLAEDPEVVGPRHVVGDGEEVHVGLAVGGGLDAGAKVLPDVAQRDADIAGADAA